MARLPGYAWKLAALAAALAVNLAIFALPDQSRTVEAFILPNLDFSQATTHWQAATGSARLIPGAPPIAVLDTPPEGGVSYISQLLMEPRRFSHLRFAFDARFRNAGTGSRRNLPGGLVVRSFDERGQRIRYWPYRVVSLEGDSDWRHFDTVLPTGPEIRAMRLYFYVSGKDAHLELRNLEVDGAAAAPWYRASRLALIAMWAAIGAWCSWPLLRRVRHKLSAKVSVVLGATIIFGTLLPQPWLAAAVRATDMIAYHLDAKVEAWLAAPETVRETPKKSPAVTEAAPPPQPAIVAPPPTVGMVALMDETMWGLDSQQIAHFVLFLLFSASLFVVFRDDRPWPWIALTLLLLAGVAEYLQVFLITRSVDIVDGGLNLAGAVAGGAVFALLNALGVRGFRTVAARFRSGAVDREGLP